MKKGATRSKRHAKPARLHSEPVRFSKVRYVAVPNANNSKERLARAIAILLKVGAGND